KACKMKAISIDPDTQKAAITLSKCVSCGACVYQCPFGAISDKSFLTKAIQIIKDSLNNKLYHTYAVVAPSIGAQYTDVKADQVYEALLKLGFYRVEEAAWGADAVAYHEAKELVEEGFLTSSCCPAFVSLVQKNYPDIAPHVSNNPSPMAMMAFQIRKKDPTAEIVFIGPCIAKKYETIYTRSKNAVSCAITFEEMQAWIDAAEIDLRSLKGVQLTNSSTFGRGFARCGGLADAVAEAIKEMEGMENFDLQAVSCNGLAECNAALLKKSKGVLKENFIEGMACDGGCIGGPACLSHSARNRVQFTKYEKQESERTIVSALGEFEQK
ncbi:MAG: 4Fe-4S binding protein, partial [Clostridia bacterium]|nr:4Fe-4S binding protein [Clostridia bacterium]